MSSRRSVRRPLVALLVGVLVGGGLMAVTPAGAEVSNAVATNWKKIWNKELKPQADQRYYTKKKSNKRYYTKADADAKYQPKGNYALNGSSYTKAESDSKYAGAAAVPRYVLHVGGPKRSGQHVDLVRRHLPVATRGPLHSGRCRSSARVLGDVGRAECSPGSSLRV